MAFQVVTEISAPSVGYATIDAFADDIKAKYGQDTTDLINAAMAAGDLLSISSQLEVQGENFVDIITHTWVDEATRDTYHADASITDELADVESNFTVSRETSTV